MHFFFFDVDIIQSQNVKFTEVVRLVLTLFFIFRICLIKSRISETGLVLLDTSTYICFTTQ